MNKLSIIQGKLEKPEPLMEEQKYLCETGAPNRQK